MSICPTCGDNTTVAACIKQTCLNRKRKMEEQQTNEQKLTRYQNTVQEDRAELVRRKGLADSVMPVAEMNGYTKAYNHHYSTLQDLLNAMREPYGRYELCYRWADGSEYYDGCEPGTLVFVIQYGLAELVGPPVAAFEGHNKNAAQAWGSGNTYQKRYALMMLVPLVGEPDDDGNAVGEEPAKQPENAPQAPVEAPKPKRGHLTPKQLDHLSESARKWHPSFERYDVFQEFVSQTMKCFPESLSDVQYKNLLIRFGGEPADPKLDEFIGQIEQALETPF